MGYYDLRHHLKLLKFERQLKHERKWMYNIDREKWSQLNSYNVAVKQHFLWQRRFQIVWLTKRFLEREIDSKKFITLLLEIQHESLIEAKRFISRLSKLVLNNEELKEFVPDDNSVFYQNFNYFHFRAF